MTTNQISEMSRGTSVAHMNTANNSYLNDNIFDLNLFLIKIMAKKNITSPFSSCLVLGLNNAATQFGNTAAGSLYDAYYST